jgi:hypothetical protein
MKNSITFFKNFFFATGVIWSLSALSILILKLSFQPKEIAMTLILPLAWALVRLFDKVRPSEE